MSKGVEIQRGPMDSLRSNAADLNSRCPTAKATGEGETLRVAVPNGALTACTEAIPLFTSLRDEVSYTPFRRLRSREKARMATSLRAIRIASSRSPCTAGLANAAHQAGDDVAMLPTDRADPTTHVWQPARTATLGRSGL